MEGIKLITDVFNAFTAQNFLVKNCLNHPDERLSSVCRSCVGENGQPLCPVCFSEHNCPKPEEVSITNWLNEQKSRVVGPIQKVQK